MQDATMNKPILLCGEAWGANEAKLQAGFVGSAGVELLKMLHEAGTIVLTSADFEYIQKFWTSSNPAHIDMIWRMHPEVYRTNVLNLHPHANRLEALCGPKTASIPGYPAIIKAKYLDADYAGELDRLGDEILRVDPNLIVALGNTPLWALCGTTGVSKLRGTTRLSTHTVSGYKVLPTYHPAAVLRQWELRPTTVADLSKAKREAGFPEIRRPEREIWIEPSLDDIARFAADYIDSAPILSVDIETAGNQITCIGFAPGSRYALVIPFHDARQRRRSYWPTAADEAAAWSLIRGILETPAPPKVFQNGLYDIAFIWRTTGIKVLGADHDTMLLHHALQPESLKGLGYLGSIYSDESAWKTERKGTKTIKRDE